MLAPCLVASPAVQICIAIVAQAFFGWMGHMAHKRPGCIPHVPVLGT